MKERIVKVLALVAGGVAGAFGGWSATLTLLAAVMGIDYVTGVLAAAAGRSDKTAHGGLSSKAGFAGLARKGVILLVVLLATLLDRAVGEAAGGAPSTVFQTASAFYYIANEGLSILENAARMSVPVPEFIKKRLEALRDGEE